MTRRRARIHGAAWRNVVYASGHALRVLDVFLPRGGTAPFPVVFYCHGGGWQGGTKGFGAGEAPLTVLDHGWALVSADYRLSQDAAWPAQIHDVKAALRFLRANAARYHIDPTRICAWGSSAGAYLANILAFTPGVAALRDASLGHASVDEGVAGLISWFSPTSFPDEDGDYTTQVAEGGPTMNRAGVTSVCSTSSQEAELIGGASTPVNPCSASQAVKDSVSVLYWIRNRTRSPKAIRIQHGVHDGGIGGDRTIPVPQARRFRDELLLAGRTFSGGGACHYQEELGLPHSVGHPLWQTSTITDDVNAWLAAHV